MSSKFITKIKIFLKHAEINIFMNTYNTFLVVKSRLQFMAYHTKKNSYLQL